MPILRYPPIFGTNQNDSISADTDQITFGLRGNDTLTGKSGSDFNFLFGGPGNDTYRAQGNSVITINDTGGDADKLIGKGLGINRPNTYVATIEDRHLLAFDTDSGQQVAVADWRDPEHRIETVELADGTFTFSQVKNAIQNSPNFLGDLTTERLVQEGILPANTNNSDVNEFLNHYENVEVDGIQKASQNFASIYEFSEYVDREFYYSENEDVANSTFSASEHFANFGVKEGREPNKIFDTDEYLKNNPDVEAAVENGSTTAFGHFVRSGIGEGREGGVDWDEQDYLNANPDVASAVNQGVFDSGYQHAVQFGLEEGRIEIIGQVDETPMMG